MRLPFKQKKFITLLSVALSQLLFSQQIIAQTIEIGVDVDAYDPTTHDGQRNGGPTYGGTSVTNVTGGANITLKATDVSTAFKPGTGPEATPTKLSILAAQGKVIDNNNILNSQRVTLGPENIAISIPDPITGGKVTIPTYNSANFAPAASVGDISVNVYDEVNNEQYINTRIANVAGGTLNVDLGTTGNVHDNATNHLKLAAKQTTLFDVNGAGGQSSELNWAGKNRVEFFGAAIRTPAPGYTDYTAQNIATFHDTFVVQTLDGQSYTHTVTNADTLKIYNDWLVARLQEGTLAGDSYDELFKRAVTVENKTITYGHLASDEQDEVFQVYGERVIIHAHGSDSAKVNITGTLEGLNAGSVIKLDDGATALIDTGAMLGNVNGAVITLTGTSSAENKGVINANFTVDGATGAIENTVNTNMQGTKSIVVADTSSFANNGILNVNSNKASGDAAGLYLNNTAVADASAYQGGDGAYYTAGNSSIINVGITNSTASGTTSGVMLNSTQSSFINEAGATIYLGRGNQSLASDVVNDVAINQKGLLSGIYLVNGGTAVNAGDITFGTKVQNAAAMYSAAGNATVMKNTGTITLSDNSDLGIPNTNYGMLVRNSGANGGIVNEGTIKLGGINGVGVKVLATGNNKAHIVTTGGSQIIVNGAADPLSGTCNYGVWVEGQGSQTATANIDGSVTLAGDGAIGIHARGNAVVDVTNQAIPTFVTGKKQIGVFAYGDGASVNLTGGLSVFDVSTDYSTMFRIENGADLFYSSNLQIETSGVGAQGIVATGVGVDPTVVQLRGVTMDMTGADSVGLVIEGGAVGLVNNGSEFNLIGDGTTGIIVDGQKHDLTGKVTATGPSDLISESVITNTGNNVTGMVVKNGAHLVTLGPNQINFASGTNNTGISIASGGTVEQRGLINIDNGTGIAITDSGSTLTNIAPTLNVNVGTGIDISNGAAVSNKAAITVNDGTGIRVSGAGSSVSDIGTILVKDGNAGVELLNGAALVLNPSLGSITTNGTAHGIWMNTGAASLAAANTTVNVLGTGNGIENKAEVADIYLQNMVVNTTGGAGIRTAVSINPSSTATVNVSGAGTGFAFVKEGGSSLTTGDLTLGPGYKFNMNGAGGIGIKALTDGGNVVTAATVDVTHANGGAALVAGTAAQTVNIGRLRSASTTAPVVDLTNSTLGTTFINQGTIFAASPTNTAVMGSASDDTIMLRAGEVHGDVNSGNGNDSVLFDGGRLDGSITMGTGENTAHIIGVDLNQTRHITAVSGASGKSFLTLSNITTAGGSMAADDLAKGVNFGNGWNWVVLDNSQVTLSDNFTLDNGVQEAGFNINPGSTLFAGNGVKPNISGIGASPLTVDNRGNIDLSNGDRFDDALTVKGNYASTGGTLRLDTLLNEGGALAKQQTDRLLIEGNARGRTIIGFNLLTAGGSDQGAFTDSNYDQVISANEGISIVQVGGSSDARSFALRDGYVASGGFAYKLYAFEPGQSDPNQRVLGNVSGNNFWDYRLANAFYGTRPQVTPQVASYVSYPIGLAAYDALMIDDLHKRLGELRFQKYLNDGTQQEELSDKELFVRYIGSDMSYSSNVSNLDAYGYDFDMRMHAFQLGMNLLNVSNRNNDNLRIGAAWTHGSSTIKPESGEGDNKTKTESDMLGLYATWQKENGFYLDGVLAASRHRAHIDTLVTSSMNKLKSRGWLGSLEAGYTHRTDDNYFIEPQAQLTYSSLRTKDSVDIDRSFAMTITTNSLGAWVFE